MASLETRNAWSRISSSSLFRTDGPDIDLCESIEALVSAIEDEPEESDWLYLGEFGDCTASDFIVGAYWALAEWHGGQWSPEYRALSILGRLFSPGMTDGPEEGTGEQIAYEQVDAYFKSKHATN